jgi:hypothetical protein
VLPTHALVARGVGVAARERRAPYRVADACFGDNAFDKLLVRIARCVDLPPRAGAGAGWSGGAVPATPSGGQMGERGVQSTIAYHCRLPESLLVRVQELQ